MIRSFPEAARDELANAQLRANLRNATDTIRAKRARVVAELPDWEALREAGRAIKADVLARLDELPARVRGRGRRRAGGARALGARRGGGERGRRRGRARARRGRGREGEVADDRRDRASTTALARAGIHALETDFAELILQLDGDWSSHILVPAIHRNRTRDPRPVRAHDRAGDRVGRPARPRRGGAASISASGSCARRSASAARTSASPRRGRSASSSRRATAACARRCRRCSSRCSGSRSSLPRFADLEVFLQLLPRSSTGERMNPYTSLWTGVTAGDGPQEFHVVLLDNGRTRVLADEVGRAGAPLHPLLGVPQRLPGLLAHRRPRVRLGLSGADRRDPDAAARRDRERGVAAVRVEPLRRLLRGVPGQDRHPAVLLHLRGEAVEASGRAAGARGDAALAWTFGSARAVRARRSALAGSRSARSCARPIRRLPGPARGLDASRDLQPLARQSFRDWWQERR